MNKFIALAGNIASGKTTAARLIKQEFDYELFEEPVIDNRFLGDYYNDMKRWSFTLQLEFLINRFEHHKLIETIDKHCVQDRTLIEDAGIFAKYLHSTGKMNDKEYLLYLDYFSHFNNQVKQPDRIIYLEIKDENILLDRILNKRKRKEEANIDVNFLKGLNSLYNIFPQIAQEKYGIPVTIINYENINVKQKKGKQKFLDLIERLI